MSANGINKVILVGYLGHDPSLGKTKGTAAPVATMRIGTTSKWKNKAGKEQEVTEWHTVVAHGYLALRLKEIAVKGRRVYVEGHLKTRHYVPSRGERKGIELQVTEIIAHDVRMLDSRWEREPGSEG